jgi:hypothetical protein
MKILFLFLSGLLLANGIPHFINGISGKDFHNPFIHRYVPKIPSPLFSVIWGLFSFSISIFLLGLVKGFKLGYNLHTASFCIGFVFASTGLSIYFRNRRIKAL